MKLTVIIPIYNEGDDFIDLFSRVQAVPLCKEIIIVDDGSDQATKQLLDGMNLGGAKRFVHEVNRGKGAAIRTALEHATGSVVIIQDADLEYFPEDYLNLLEVYEGSQAKAVYGVRDLSQRSPLMRWGNWFVTGATNLLFGAALSDMETCYKLVDRELLKELALTSRGFEIEAEISGKLLRRKVEIVETPIRYQHRDEGKKLSIWDGIPTIRKLFECRFQSR